MKRKIASEMIRVLKNDGMIIWYDYHINNPQNPDVRGVKRKEIYELFPNYEIVLKTCYACPPYYTKNCSFFFYFMLNFGKNSIPLHPLSWHN
jgi:hypothetical protein